VAIGDPYGDLLAFVERVGSGDVYTLQKVLDAASRAVESFTRRQFNKQTSATVRQFRPVDWRRVAVDDFHTVTGLAVTVNGTAWDLANVDPRPWNGMVDGQPGWPFYDLIAKSGSWPCDATVAVTAQWGWPAVPEGINRATLDVAAIMYQSGGSSFPVQSESVAGYAVTYQVPSFSAGDQVPAEMAAAVPYRRKRFGIA
jgi:hypothetical protein